MKTLLSPKDLALAIGVSESSLKRWSDGGLLQVTRTAGGHRRITISEAIRFIRHTKSSVLRPDILDLPALESAAAQTHDDRTAGELMFQALRNGDGFKARGLMLSYYVAGRSLAWLFDGPIRSAMHQLGELWLHDPQGIFLEHRATDICIQGINRLRSVLGVPADGALKAVGGAVQGDPYILPSMMASCLLADLGCREVNLGPQTPLEVLWQAADHLDVQLVWLSCSQTDGNRMMCAGVLELADHLATRRVQLVLGGRGWGTLNAGSHANVHHLASMAELAAFAKGLAQTTFLTSPSSSQTELPSTQIRA